MKKIKRLVVVPVGPRHEDSRTEMQMCLNPIICRSMGDGKTPEVCFSRPKRAVRVAKEENAALLIAGCRHGGQDVRLFTAWAKEQGIRHVFGSIYRDDGKSEGSTFADAQGVAELLFKHPLLMYVRWIYPCTDNWHMPRAKTMIEKEIEKCATKHARTVIDREGGSREHRRQFRFRYLNVYDGIRSTPAIEAAEWTGTNAYAWGEYKSKHPSKYWFEDIYLGPRSVQDPLHLPEPTHETPETGEAGLARVIPLIRQG